MSQEEILNLLVLTFLVVFFPTWRRNYFFPRSATVPASLPSTRIAFYDFLKGISIVAVIVIHLGYVFGQDNNIDDHLLFFNFLNNVCRFCIPIFFICSGLLLTPWDKVTEKTVFYQKKFFRIFLPYIILVTMMAVYHSTSLQTYLQVLLRGSGLVPFYFVTVLLQLYLFYPILSKLRNKKYFLLITFLLSLVPNILFSPITFLGVPVALEFIFFFSYGIYRRDFFLGQNKIEKTELNMWLGMVVIYIFVALAYPAMYFNMNLFYGLAIFNILYYHQDTFLKYFAILYKMLANIGIYSFWIFLFHYFIELKVYALVIDWPINFFVINILIVFITLFLAYFFGRLLDFIYNKILQLFEFN